MTKTASALEWYDELMWEPPHRHHHSYGEYVQFERYSGSKHEYINGDIIAVAGGSPDHAAISANLILILGRQLIAKPCRVYTSDLKIRIVACNVATYPDVSVVCGQPVLDPEDKAGHTILNPTVLIEVLSPTTAKYDCTDKVAFYKQIDTLQEIMLVDFARQRCLVWRKGKTDWMGWTATETTEGAARLESIDCEVSLAEVYRDPFAAS
jgi:Uma2 family endonuclease